MNFTVHESPDRAYLSEFNMLMFSYIFKEPTLYHSLDPPHRGDANEYKPQNIVNN